MDISLNELYKGKATIIKTKEFLPTRNYVEPFINKMSSLTDDFRIQVKLPDQVTTFRDETDVTYNRVLIQAILPKKYTIDYHDEVIGMVCGIDLKTPIVKIYRGYLNQACTNMCVFNPSWQVVQELSDSPINFNCLKELLEMTNDFPKKLEYLKSTFISREDRVNDLGKWVDYTLRACENDGFNKIKLASSVAIDAYKQLYVDDRSNYFIPVGQDPSLFTVYNSFTQITTNDTKDICHKFNKSMLITNLLCPNLVNA
jgi:hypothetical protein